MLQMLVAVGALGGVVGLVAYTLLAQAHDKAVVRSSLRQLGGYEVDNVRDWELLNPLRDRALAPLTGALTRVGRRLTPTGYVESVRRKLVLAGRGDEDSLDRFLAVRVSTVAALPVTFVAVLGVLGLRGGAALALWGFLAVVLLLAPDAVLERRGAARQHELRVRLPDVLDLLVISVEAGLGFEQALDRTIGAVPGPLTEEFSRMLGEVRAGASRSEAMRALERRTDIPEMRSFVLAILQADTFGVSIGRVLRTQADEMRVKRRQLAQEQAQKAPVKMLLPMVFCIFPSLFVVVLGPAVINISRSL